MKEKEKQEITKKLIEVRVVEKDPKTKRIKNTEIYSEDEFSDLIIDVMNRTLNCIGFFRRIFYWKNSKVAIITVSLGTLLGKFYQRLLENKNKTKK